MKWRQRMNINVDGHLPTTKKCKKKRKLERKNENQSDFGMGCFMVVVHLCPATDAFPFHGIFALSLISVHFMWRFFCCCCWVFWFPLLLSRVYFVGGELIIHFLDSNETSHDAHKKDTAHSSNSTTTKWKQHSLALLSLHLVYSSCARCSMDFQLKWKREKRRREAYFKSISNFIFVYEYDGCGACSVHSCRSVTWNEVNRMNECMNPTGTRTSDALKSVHRHLNFDFCLTCDVRALRSVEHCWRWFGSFSTTISLAVHISQLVILLPSPWSPPVAAGPSVAQPLESWVHDFTNGCGKLLNGTNIKIKRMDY